MSLLELSSFLFHTYYIEWWWINFSADPEVKIEAKSFQKFIPPINVCLNVEVVQSKAQSDPHHASSCLLSVAVSESYHENMIN